MGLGAVIPARGTLAQGAKGGEGPVRKIVLRTATLTVVALLAMAGVATAIVLREGPIEVVGEGGFTPTTLPSTNPHRSPCTGKARSGPPTARCRRSSRR